jgi:CheY-like chemotaxis protein
LSRKNTLPLAGFTVTFTVVAEAGNGREALQVYRQIKPDVVLMDLRLPEVGGVEATMSIRKEFPDARVIILTTFDMDEDIYRAIQGGAKSYLLKDTPYTEIARAIRMVSAGQQIIPQKVANRLASRLQRADLSHIEMEVLQLIGHPTMRADEESTFVFVFRGAMRVNYGRSNTLPARPQPTLNSTKFAPSAPTRRLWSPRAALCPPPGFPGYKSLSGAGRGATAGHLVLRQGSPSIARSLCRSSSRGLRHPGIPFFFTATPGI